MKWEYKLYKLYQKQSDKNKILMITYKNLMNTYKNFYKLLKLIIKEQQKNKKL